MSNKRVAVQGRNIENSWFYCGAEKILNAVSSYTHLGEWIRVDFCVIVGYLKVHAWEQRSNNDINEVISASKFAVVCQDL